MKLIQKFLDQRRKHEKYKYHNCLLQMSVYIMKYLTINSNFQKKKKTYELIVFCDIFQSLFWSYPQTELFIAF